MQNKLWRLDDLNPNNCVNYSDAVNEDIEIREGNIYEEQIIKRARLTESTFNPGVKSLIILIECEE